MGVAAMNKINAWKLGAAALLASVALATAAGEPALTDDGLAPIKVRNVDKAYKRPGASLAGYDKILLKPVNVAFSKSWDSREFGNYGLSAKDVEKIRSSLAQLAEETFRKSLTKGGYTFVTAADAKVLEMEAQIVDLYVNAPDVSSTANVNRSYVMSAGEMRLVLTLRDAVTGTVLYRAVDHKRGTDTGRLVWASSVFNRAEAELALTGWAGQLKNALDAARAP
jgi:hypothetical protein